MTDALLVLRRAAELLAGLVVATVVGALTLTLANLLPFADPSWLPEAFGGTLAAGVVVLVGWLLLRRSTGTRTLWIMGTAGPAFLASSHLGLLLHGTPHYLFGLGGDQINRVAYLTRFADSPALRDAFYADAAPFYPAQWFWAGGRLAALVGEPGWEFYKPYAILTMSIAGAIAFVAWRWLVPTRVAVLFGLTTAVVGGQTNAYEPYSWILICLLPQAVAATLILCDRVRRGGRPTWPMVVSVGAYLGWAALSYTLIAGFAAVVVGLVVVGCAWAGRGDRAVVGGLLTRLAAMAGISAAIALVFWHHYLLSVITGAETEKSVANDFAPRVSASWPLPMFEAGAAGLLCLLGTIWVLVTVWPRGAGRLADRGSLSLRSRVAAGRESRAEPPVIPPAGGQHSSPLPTPELAVLLARTFGVLSVAVLGWFVLSGLRAVTGSTLLPFRMIPVIALALSLAGVVAALALARWAVATSPVDSRGRVRAAAVVLAGLAAVQMVQHVTDEDADFAAAARANPAVPEDLLGAIAEMTPGREPSDLVVLTSDPSLYAYRPFFTYQAPAQAYATPAGLYQTRVDEIRRWSDTSGPEELAAALDSGPVRAPDVFVLEREGTGSLTFPATINTMPLEGNNTREDIPFSLRQFADRDLFDVRSVGSRMVILRH